MQTYVEVIKVQIYDTTPYVAGALIHNFLFRLAHYKNNSDYCIVAKQTAVDQAPICGGKNRRYNLCCILN